MDSSDTSKVRILILGDGGVGKTTFLNSVNQELYPSPVIEKEAARKVRKTVGCNPQIQLFKHLGKDYWIEWLEIGGGTFKTNDCRKCFYTSAPIMGIVLVHDLTNKKSLDNLWKWLNEAMTYIPRSEYNEFSLDLTGVSIPSPSKSGLAIDGEYNMPPLLLVGMKLDQVTSLDAFEQPRSSILDDYGGHSLQMACPKSTPTQTSIQGFERDEASRSLSSFLSKVIETSKMKGIRHRSGSSGSSPNYRRSFGGELSAKKR